MSAFPLLVWQRTISVEAPTSSSAHFTILWDTVFVKSTRRSGHPIFFPKSASICVNTLHLHFIRFADFFILSYHSVMSAYDYNTHVLSSFCSFRYINMGLESIYPLPDNRALIILWVWLTFSNCKLV